MATDNVAKLVVFTLGRLAVEDFTEILLLCANGYGVAGLKLLRGMFERIVTAGYLADHPEEAADFRDYYFVQEMKWITHNKDLGIDPRKCLRDEHIAQLRENYERVKGKFVEKVCKRCGTTKRQGSWTKKDLKTMAREVHLEEFYGPAYFEPTLQIHTTVIGILSRLEEDEDGVISFIPGPQRKEADAALFNAHMCLVLVLEHLNAYFSLGLDDEIGKMKGLFRQCWPLKVRRGREKA